MVPASGQGRVRLNAVSFQERSGVYVPATSLERGSHFYEAGYDGIGDWCYGEQPGKCMTRKTARITAIAYLAGVGMLSSGWRKRKTQASRVDGRNSRAVNQEAISRSALQDRLSPRIPKIRYVDSCRSK